MMTPELLEKVESARLLLYIHGFMPDSEDRRVRHRIKKACDKAGITVQYQSIFQAKQEETCQSSPANP